ncbi:zinc finger protein 271-like isoform X2 [Armigeres subalbatus]|uniref:zinc finger protein 271-like isoform X2 n=1 Tax=Armigeres subalbatus TaxID=124917 RepID=UPI002ED18890
MKRSCRLCEQQQESLIPLFNAAAPSKQNRLPLMVSIFTGLEVERCDRLPKYICKACLEQLEQSYRLSIQCRNTLRKELVQPKSKLDNRCLTCGGLLDKKAMQANVSFNEKWNKTITDMIQYLSCALKTVKDQRGQHFWLACECCLEKMDRSYRFKEQCLKSDTNWLQKLSHPWEKMEVDSKNLNQLVVDLFAEVIQERNDGDMFYCSVCLLRVALEQVGEKCEGCRLMFRNVFNEQTTDTSEIETSAELVQAKETKQNELIMDEKSSEPPMVQNDQLMEELVEMEEILYEEPLSETAIEELHNDRRYKKVDKISHKCCRCDKCFSFERNLQIHRTVKHKSTNNAELPENSCQYCHEHFDDKSKLLQHQHRRIHTVSYQCQTNGCTFTNTDLELMETHCNENPHQLQSNNAENNPDLKHFDIIGSMDDCIDVLKLKSEMCCRCYKLFDSLEEKLVHLQTHTIQKSFPFQCDVCGRGFGSKISLNIHNNIRRHGKHYFCRPCNLFIWNKTTYISHVAMHHFPTSLEDQIETEMDDFVTCCGCKEKFDTEEDIILHREEKHPKLFDPVPKGKAKCDYCQTTVAASAMRKHVATYEVRESYRCKVPFCRFRNKRIDLMKKHTYAGTHHNADGEIIQRNNNYTATNRLYCCIRTCGYSSTDNELLIEHFKQKHKAKRDYYSKYYDGREFKCLVCTRGFNYRRTLIDHKYRIRYFRCKVCDKTDPISERAAHANCRNENPPAEATETSRIKRKTKKYKITKLVCHICGKLVKHLESHMIIHENKRNFECDICHKRFNKFDIAMKHQRVHDGQRMYVCRQGCGKSYKADGDRVRHEKLVHFGIKPFACEYCPSAFVRERDRRLHTRKHTGQKLYPCSQCGTGFDKKAEYIQHETECSRNTGVNDS